MASYQKRRRKKWPTRMMTNNSVDRNASGGQGQKLPTKQVSIAERSIKRKQLRKKKSFRHQVTVFTSLRVYFQDNLRGEKGTTI